MHALEANQPTYATEAQATDQPLSLDSLPGLLPSEEDVIRRDHRTCDCELTYVHRKRHAALGTAIEIRLCCLAKKVEELAGLPPGTFFKAIDFDPSWEWDCDKPTETKHTQPDGSVIETLHRPGPPPRWLRERMQKKGVPIHNLPEHLKQ